MLNEWRTAPRFPDYEVSSSGEVRRKTASTYPPGYVLGGDYTRNGYRRVQLNRDGITHRVHVNRIVAEAFHGAPPTKVHQAAHLNGIRSDNRAENLAWKTASENHADKVVHGTWQGGENHNQAIMTEADVLRIMGARSSLRGGKNKRGSHRIAVDFNLPRHAVQAVISGRTWTHITGGAI